MISGVCLCLARADSVVKGLSDLSDPIPYSASDAESYTPQGRRFLKLFKLCGAIAIPFMVLSLFLR